MWSKMFTSLKNKIKEETGNEVPRLFHPKQHSPNHESTSSLGSTISSDNDANSMSPTNRDNLCKENEMIEKLERQYAHQLEERDKEWQEKVTSLQNNMHAAQAVWCDEAAAARREAREEVRRNSRLTEQLNVTVSNSTRLQNKLDQVLEEIESERRSWALERQRLASEAEDAEHRLSLATSFHSTSSDDTIPEGVDSNEFALKRKLEEAQLHLHDIKTSWSGQIATLETQVGRLSRQAGEEGAERRRVEKERDTLMERLREKETQLEQAQATLEDKESKMALLAAEAGEASRCGRAARCEAQSYRQTADLLSEKLAETEKRLAQSHEQNEFLYKEKSDLEGDTEKKIQHISELTERIRSWEVKQEVWIDTEKILGEELKQLRLTIDTLEISSQEDKLKMIEVCQQNVALTDQMDSLKRELNEIHERYDMERREKEESLMRNAHMSQTLEIYRQEMRQQDVEVVDLKSKVKHLENTLVQHTEERRTLQRLQDAETKLQADMEKVICERDGALISEKQLQECIKDLNVQLAEKSKNVRVLQNRLTDMKKTLQRELRGGQVDPLGSSVVEGSSEDPDITNKYLKHVLIKFLTSREVEARQLTRAVAALLGLSPQEEALLRDTLAWRSGFAAWLTPPPKHSLP